MSQTAVPTPPAAAAVVPVTPRGVEVELDTASAAASTDDDGGPANVAAPDGSIAKKAAAKGPLEKAVAKIGGRPGKLALERMQSRRAQRRELQRKRSQTHIAGGSCRVCCKSFTASWVILMIFMGLVNLGCFAIRLGFRTGSSVSQHTLAWFSALASIFIFVCYIFACIDIRKHRKSDTSGGAEREVSFLLSGACLLVLGFPLCWLLFFSAGIGGIQASEAFFLSGKILNITDDALHSLARHHADGIQGFHIENSTQRLVSPLLSFQVRDIEFGACRGGYTAPDDRRRLYDEGLQGLRNRSDYNLGAPHGRKTLAALVTRTTQMASGQPEAKWRLPNTRREETTRTNLDPDWIWWVRSRLEPFFGANYTTKVDGEGYGIDDDYKRYLPAIYYDSTCCGHYVSAAGNLHRGTIGCGTIRHACLTPVFEKPGVADEVEAEFIKELRARTGPSFLEEDVLVTATTSGVTAKYKNLTSVIGSVEPRRGPVRRALTHLHGTVVPYPPWTDSYIREDTLETHTQTGANNPTFPTTLMTTKQANDAVFKRFNASHHRVQAWAYCPPVGSVQQPGGGTCNSREFYESECGASWLKPSHTGFSFILASEQAFGQYAIDLTTAVGWYEKLLVNPEAPLIHLDRDPWEYVAKLNNNTPLTLIYMIVLAPLPFALAIAWFEAASTYTDGMPAQAAQLGCSLLAVLGLVGFLVFRCIYPIMLVEEY